MRNRLTYALLTFALGGAVIESVLAFLLVGFVVARP
jgi:hypothetical protein